MPKESSAPVLLELHDRLRRRGVLDGLRFGLPLTLRDLADYVGENTRLAPPHGLEPLHRAVRLHGVTPFSVDPKLVGLYAAAAADGRVPGSKPMSVATIQFHLSAIVAGSWASPSTSRTR